MATIKAYTDPSQSKTLSKILPLKSADGGWYGTDNPLAANTEYWLYTKYTEKAALPAWSLAALLDVLNKSAYFANEAGIAELSSIKATKWCVSILNCGKIENCYADNPVDACYEMILKLHELNLL